MLFNVKIFVSGQDKASKDTFFLFNLIFWGNLGLKISDLKEKNVIRGGGSEKRQKSVTFYLNCPLGQIHSIIKFCEVVKLYFFRFLKILEVNLWEIVSIVWLERNLTLRRDEMKQEEIVKNKHKQFAVLVVLLNCFVPTKIYCGFMTSLKTSLTQICVDKCVAS